MSCEGCEEGAYVIDKLAKLLAEIAIIVNGPEPPLTRWSYHDLPEKVRALKQAQQPAALAVPEGVTLPHDFAQQIAKELRYLIDEVYGKDRRAYDREIELVRRLDAMLAAAERAQGECPHAARCDCLGGCKRGMRGNGAVEGKP